MGKNVTKDSAGKAVKVGDKVVTCMIFKDNPDITMFDLNKQNVVESIVEYGHEQNMKFIAEGIENYEVLKKVIELNVDYVQGYYCGKPASEVYELDEKIVSEILDLSK